MTTLTSYLGIPVEGEIIKPGRSETRQRPAEEFAPILKAAIEAPGVAAVRWEQYTPYFNDGEPCYFGIRAYNMVKPTVEVGEDDDSEYDNDEGFIEVGHVQFKGGDEYKYVQVPLTATELAEAQARTRYGSVASTRWERVATGKTYPRHESYDAVQELEDALNGGEFDDVLLDAFGDHARVTVTTEGIEVEFYEHD